MDETHFSIDDLDGYQFEELIAKIMKKNGYENIKVTQKSRDLGKDIIMNDSEGNIIIVECKHNKFVGRPVLQKLQGAMQHEALINPDKMIAGMVVTSGEFSKEALSYNKDINNIELIDGKKLKDICRELNIIVLNGKIQILTDNSFKNITPQDSINTILNGYTKIYGSKQHEPDIKSTVSFEPTVFIQYQVGFSTSTSIGCIDSYGDNGNIFLDGKTGHNLKSDLVEFFFNGNLEIEKIERNDKKKKIPFEFTENDAEEFTISQIIAEHSHKVQYTGNNNVTYTKNCIPKKEILIY